MLSKDIQVLGRVRFKCIKDASSKNLIPFACENVAKKSLIVTDGWSGYNKLKLNGYIHEKKIDN